MLIATAGHVDHGKSTLVRALTGVDTDRLPEEKARGISIDLGFAYWRPEPDVLIGFVDVPGHERFVRNMLAGVGGVDLALIVVAADDGIMPQTVEHVTALDLLGIARGVVAITKADKADAARIAALRAEISAWLAKTAFADAPIVEVSAHQGAGLDDLAALLRTAPAAPRPAGGGFRMAVDRCFTVSGAGTVVTGTVLAGVVAAGAQLVLSPRSLPVRVRGLQSGGRKVENVGPGERCAINLADVEVAAVHRGDWLVAPGMNAPTARCEARIRVPETCRAALRHGVPLTLHVGAAALAARVLVPRQQPIAPGEERDATVVLDHPTCLVNGTRFVLRDASGRELIGGGRVIDPFAPARRRKGEDRAAITAALEAGDPGSSLALLLAIPGHEIDTAAFARSFNRTADELAALLAGCEAIAIPGTTLIIAPATLAARADAIVAALSAWHREHPERGGMTRRELKLALPHPGSAPVLSHGLRTLLDAGSIEAAGPLLRLPGHAASFSATETALWHTVEERFADQSPRPFSAAELASELRTGEPAVRAMLYRRRVNGDVWAITENRFMLRDHASALAATAAALASRNPHGFTAAEFRDATAIGRNHIIRILEFLDRVGVTVRRGDARVMRADYATIIGPASPWLAG